MAIFLLSLPMTTPYLRGDGNGYYAYVTSVVLDRDMDFSNQYEHADQKFKGNPDNWVRTATGRIGNKWAPGAPLLWLPFFMAGHTTTLALRWLGADLPADGYALPDLWATAMGTALYGFLGLWLSYRIALRFASEAAARLAVIGIWFASSVPVYFYLLPFLAHAVACFTSALFIWWWLRLPRPCRDARQLILGFIGGLCGLVRYECGVVLLIPFIDICWATWNRQDDVRGMTKSLAYLLMGAGMGLLPLLVSRAVLYGNPMETGYEGEIVSHDWRLPHLIGMFFSSGHGTFTWTPILLLAFVGYGMFIRRAPWVAGPIALPFVILVFVVGCWWGTEMSSFGNRFFVSYMVLFVLGAAVLADAMLGLVPRRAIAMIITALIAWNVLLIGQFGLGMIPRDSPLMDRFSWSTLARNQFRVPVELVQRSRVFFSDRERFLAEVNRIEQDQRARGQQL